ncbi:hypothetical protein [Paludibaculum fermentans]|uniref:Uncharacterized protein n=1 Tax=Paludibaculum fermentans TaxID=1473598 RepID=A0A7S7NNV3_PALFE|nr:hypothetical protein [Paludibaculum fermentans]QOY86534.1 hypothetical protein IRI77_27595 [Paludibaculum fermentans]
MKKTTMAALALAVCATSGFGQQSSSTADKSAKAAQAKAATKRVPAAAGTELPAGAVRMQEGVYKAQDAKGKTWIYSRTPFGWTKTEESSFKVAAQASEVPSIRAIAVEGDKVKFERDSPFGKSVWTKPVSDLAPEEKAAYELKLNAKNEK